MPQLISWSIILLLELAAVAQAYTTFDTNCSLPTTPANYVSSAGTRSTLDILWSCLFTIFACTWTVQHLNVPEQREGRDPGWRGDIKWALKRTWISTKWMLATFIAPELLLAKNMGDLGDAREHLAALKKFADKDGVPWTMTHSLFANMGGFVIRSYAGDRIGRRIDSSAQTTDQQSLSPEEIPTNLKTERSRKSLRIANEVQGYTQVTSDSDQESGHSTLLTPSPYHLLAKDILALRKSGAMKRLPYISKEELNDKSKSDSFVRTIAVGQVLWITVQIICRAARHLAISQLEIAVVAFSACAIIIYGLNWEKPKGVQVPWTIICYPGAIPPTVPDIIAKSGHSAENGIVGDFIFLLGLIGFQEHSPGAKIRNDFNEDVHSFTVVGLTMGVATFGAIHLTAWNFVFPTRAEQIVWWTTSAYCTTFLFWIDIIILITENSHDCFMKYFSWLPRASIPLYILARLFLLVEVFRTLCFLPPDAYVATWATNIPHLT